MDEQRLLSRAPSDTAVLAYAVVGRSSATNPAVHIAVVAVCCVIKLLAARAGKQPGADISGELHYKKTPREIGARRLAV